MPEDVIGQNTPAGGETPAAPVAAPATPAAPPVSATSTPQAPPASATTPPAEGWVPSYRVRETREAALREAQSQWANKEAELRAEAQRYQEQLRALVGVQPPQNPQVEAIKQQFSQLFPGLSQLEQRASDLQGLIEQAQNFQAQQQHYWQSYGRQNLDRLFGMAQETYGSPLSDEAKRHLHSSFLGFVQSSPEMEARYETDPSIVQDFWKAFSANFVDPARRVAAAGAASRVPGAIPQDTPSGAPRSTPPPAPANLDDRVANAWLQYQQSQLNKG
jgi:hypothetical protein